MKQRWLNLVTFDELDRLGPGDRMLGTLALQVAYELRGRKPRQAWRRLHALVTEWDELVEKRDARVQVLRPVMQGQCSLLASEFHEDADQVLEYARHLVSHVNTAEELRLARWFCASVIAAFAGPQMPAPRTSRKLRS